MTKQPEGATVRAVIQARSASTRLPNKVQADICGKPLFYWIYHRMTAVPDLEEIVLATTDDPTDDALTAHAESYGIRVHRGPTDNLAKRIADAAPEADIIVRLWGDCPCVCPSHVRVALSALHSADLDHLNTFDADGRHTVPYGLGFEIYKRQALELAGQSNPRNQLYPFLYVRDALGWPSGIFSPPEYPWGDAVFAVDYQVDLDRTSAIFGALGSDFTASDLAALPGEILRMGVSHPRNAEYTEAS